MGDIKSTLAVRICNLLLAFWHVHYRSKVQRCYCTCTSVHISAYATFYHVQNTDRLRDEIHSLQTKLSEVSSTAIEQGERLREVRRAKRELDSDNNDLKTALKNAQVWL